jgi:hypothetical protein
MSQLKNRLKKMENRVGVEKKQDIIVVLPGENEESKLSEFKRKHPDAPPPKVLAVCFVASPVRKEEEEPPAPRPLPFEARLPLPAGQVQS